MSLRIPRGSSLRLLTRRLNSTHPQCLRQGSQLRTLATNPNKPRNPLDPISLHRLDVQRREYYKRRFNFSAVGLVLGMVIIGVLATSVDIDAKKTAKLDAGSDDDKRKDDPMVVLGRERKVVVQKLGEEPEEIADVVETGTSTVPTFPRVLAFADNESGGPAAEAVEYQLLGVGIRTVSFLGIEVYVVGMYIATDDIASLQHNLIRKISPVGSTLVAGEKEKLRALLYDPEESETAWSDVIRDSGARTLLRIVPTRNTDFHHLRDGWVRQITARAKLPTNKEEYSEESFGAAMGEFKKLFNRGSVPKKRELLLSRDEKGKLAVWYDDGKNGAQRLGEVVDERISRAVWLNYLAGKAVASEGARKSIVDSVMEFVERPVGTVATQVHESHV